MTLISWDNPPSIGEQKPPTDHSKEDRATQKRNAQAASQLAATRAEAEQQRAVRELAAKAAQAKQRRILDAKLTSLGKPKPQVAISDQAVNIATAPPSSSSAPILGLVGILAIPYFFPSIVGCRKKNASAIFVLNFFLGWTFVGWVVALVWATTKDEAKIAAATP
ncbi:MAG: superinfection immunity protein [Chthoniobacterales bacterium]